MVGAQTLRPQGDAHGQPAEQADLPADDPPGTIGDHPHVILLSRHTPAID
ncbi:hypothetical protein Mth01_05180 [Sphaerimonospora thailandensis]|uniref:Uncharacterized protein n=1 Tax=Sphaerimonospora thailandensis TaxID=795644 RepID=A0A8J3R5P7_9ACTN|nr:hypothetical protein Mth01_05180 [Sphaerimonospora thailandensis]